MMKRALILMGKAGSGKSTIGRGLAERLGVPYISTGEIARTLIAGDWIERGEMAPEGAMREAFEEAILGRTNVILDGMPRKAEQVDYLDTIFDEVYYYEIHVSYATAERRLLMRGRVDDTEEAIRQRFLDYATTTREAIISADRRHGVRVLAAGYLEPEKLITIIEKEVRGKLT